MHAPETANFSVSASVDPHNDIFDLFLWETWEYTWTRLLIFIL